MNNLSNMSGNPVAETAAVDRSVLHAMSDGDATTAREFIDLYQRLNNADLIKLKSAMAAADQIGAIQASHRIVGASRTIGAIDLAAVCERIECACRAGRWDEVNNSLPELQNEITRVDAYLNSYLLDLK